MKAKNKVFFSRGPFAIHVKKPLIDFALVFDKREQNYLSIGSIPT